MKKRLIIESLLFLFITVLLNSSCSSGKKALEKGNYYESVMKSVNRLRASPGNKRASNTLNNGYPLAVKWYQDNIDMAIVSNQPFKWGKVVGYYQALNSMTLAIKRCPGALRIIPNPLRYDVKLQEAKKKAAPECYDAGVIDMNLGNREAARRAYYHFINADKFVSGYKDVKSQIAMAYDLATLKVLIKQIPFNIGKYEFSLGFFEDKVNTYYQTKYKRQFVEFYTENDAANEVLLKPDHVVNLKFFDFNIGSTKMVKNTVEVVSADSVKVGEVELKDGSSKPVFNKVKAKVSKQRIEVGAVGILSVKIIDAKRGNILLNDKINGKFIWFHEWGSYNGDERALTPELKSIVKNSAIVVAPNAQELFSEFTESIYSELIHKINTFYAKY